MYFGNFNAFTLAVSLYYWCCVDCGDNKQALKLAKELLSIRMSSLSSDHPDIACCENEFLMCSPEM